MLFPPYATVLLSRPLYIFVNETEGSSQTSWRIFASCCKNSSGRWTSNNYIGKINDRLWRYKIHLQSESDIVTYVFPHISKTFRYTSQLKYSLGSFWTIMASLVFAKKRGIIESQYWLEKLSTLDVRKVWKLSIRKIYWKFLLNDTHKLLINKNRLVNEIRIDRISWKYFQLVQT